MTFFELVGYITIAVLASMMLRRLVKWLRANGMSGVRKAFRCAPRWIRVRVLFSLWYTTVAAVTWIEPGPVVRMYLRERRAMRRYGRREILERLRRENNWRYPKDQQ